MWDLSLDTDFLAISLKETYTETRFFFNADLREGISMWFCDKGTEKYMPTYTNWQQINTDLEIRFSIEKRYGQSGPLSRGRVRRYDELHNADLAGVHCTCTMCHLAFTPERPFSNFNRLSILSCSCRSTSVNIAANSFLKIIRKPHRWIQLLTIHRKQPTNEKVTRLPDVKLTSLSPN